MNVVLTWDDRMSEQELDAPEDADVRGRIAQLDGVDRTLVTVFRDDAHMAAGGSASSGIVVYGTFENEIFWQLVGLPDAVGKTAVFAGGQAGEYQARHIVTVAEAVRAVSEFLRKGVLATDLRWERV